jgi:hypothetical protein
MPETEPPRCYLGNRRTDMLVLFLALRRTVAMAYPAEWRVDMKIENSKEVEMTELSRDQLDLVAGGIYFYVPKLQTGTPVWLANIANAELGLDRLVNLPY